MSPALPIVRLLALIAENSGVILTVAGGVGLAYILTRPENKQAINSSLSNLSQAIGQLGSQVATMSSPVAINALRQLDQTKQELRSFQEKLGLIDKVLPIAKEFLGKVTRLLQKIDQVSNKLSDRARVNPLDIQPAPFTFRDGQVREFPASPNVDDLVRDRATQEVQRKAPPGTQSPPISSNPFVDSSPPISNRQNRAKPRPTTIDDPIIPPPDNIIWTPIDREKPFTTPPSSLRPPRDESSLPFPGQNKPFNGPRYLPPGTKSPPVQIYTNKDPFADFFAKDKTVPGTRPTSRTKPKINTNQPGCKDPNSWSEKFKRFLEFAIDELGQELIQTMADRAGQVFEKAFAARDEAKRKNPDFDKGKPDLEKTLGDSIGKEYDKLSPKTKADLEKYYEVKDYKNGKNIISRQRGRANDPTLPPIQIKNGFVIPELLAKSNRLSSGVDLGKEFANGHNGFNPTKSGVLKTAPNGEALSQTAALKTLNGPVQIHHKVPDALWQSHQLTQAMQARIDAGSKTILGLNDGSNLIAAYKSPEAKKAYQKMLTEIGKTAPQLKTDIEGNLRRLESGKAMLSNLYHNGSHDGWSERAKEVLTKELKKLRQRFPDISKAPDKELNEAYKRATKQLGDELNKANKKLKQNQPLSEEEKKWAKDYCKPKDQHNKKPHTKISADPNKRTAWERFIAATSHFDDPVKENSNDRSPSAPSNSLSLQAENTSQKDLHNPIRSPIWAETVNLANELKKSSNDQSLQVRAASSEIQQGSARDSIWAETMALANKLKKSNEMPVEQQVVLQPPENVKQPKKGGFEIG